MSTSLEPGGRMPPIGALYSAAFQDVTQNIAGYLMAGLGMILVVMPVALVATFLGLFVMYFVLAVGLVGTAVGAAAVSEGNADAGGIVGLLGGAGTIAFAFFVMFGIVSLGVAAVAPVNASLSRAIAKHQRGEGALEFNSAFSTVGQDMLSAIGVLAFTTSAAMFGVFFCYVGALVPAVLFGFAPMMVSLHRKGVIDALRTSARHAMAHPVDHLVLALATMATGMVAAYIPVLGHAFLIALNVRAYRMTFGDGPEPAMDAAA